MNTAIRYVWLLLVTWNCPAFGQADSVRVLPEFIIQQSRLDEYAHTGFELEPDSTALRMYEGQTLAQLLQSQGLALLRSYAPGGIASASIRGAGSNHTAVLWHGINIESPMNGQIDLGQVPVGLFNQFSLQSGGNSVAYGSGSIGGTIQFARKARFARGWQAQISGQTGSFGLLGTNASLNYSKASLDIGGGISLGKSDNNFTYLSPISGQDKAWEHAQQKLNGFHQHINWQISSKHMFYTRVWYQQNSSEVPTSSFVIRPGSAIQKDKALRSLLGYLFTKDNFELRYQGAFLYQDQLYRDSVASISSDNTTTSFIQHLEGTWKVTASSQLTAGVQYLHEDANTNNYGKQSPARNRVSLSTIYQANISGNWSINVGLREELIDGELTPLSPFLNTHAWIRNNMRLNLSLNRNYKIPSLNDYYWLGAGGRGNPDLNPETSLGGEAGFLLNLNEISFEFTGYSQHVDDWIQWVPTTSQVWSPINVKQVWLRGLETTASWNTTAGAFEFKMQGIYRYTRATNDEMYSANKETHRGKQLLLTPVHSGSLLMEAFWHNFTLLSTTAITGKQYSDADNSTNGQMDSYITTDLWLQKNWIINTSSLGLSLGVNNFFNTTYVARPGYPMPGRNYIFRVIYEFNQKRP